MNLYFLKQKITNCSILWYHLKNNVEYLLIWKTKWSSKMLILTLCNLFYRFNKWNIRYAQYIGYLHGNLVAIKNVHFNFMQSLLQIQRRKYQIDTVHRLPTRYWTVPFHTEPWIEIFQSTNMKILHWYIYQQILTYSKIALWLIYFK